MASSGRLPRRPPSQWRRRKRAKRETSDVDPAALPSREPDPVAATLPDLGSVLDLELSRLPRTTGRRSPSAISKAVPTKKPPSVWPVPAALSPSG